MPSEEGLHNQLYFCSILVGLTVSDLIQYPLVVTHAEIPSTLFPIVLPLPIRVCHRSSYTYAVQRGSRGTLDLYF